MSLSSRKQLRTKEKKKVENGNNGQDPFVIGDFEEELIRQTARAFLGSVVFTNDNDGNDSLPASDPQQPGAPTHQRSSSDSSSSIELTQVFTRKPPRPSPAGSTRKESPNPDSLVGIMSDDEEESSQTETPKSKRRQAKLTREADARRESMCLMKNMGSFRVREEWDNENAAREIYDLPPPPDLPSESEEEQCSDWDSEWESMPRASVLNRHIGWQSLRRLVNESPTERDESLSPDEERGVNVGEKASEETDHLLRREESTYSSLSLGQVEVRCSVEPHLDFTLHLIHRLRTSTVDILIKYSMTQSSDG